MGESVNSVYIDDKGRCRMVIVLRCRDVSMDCDFEVRAGTSNQYFDAKSNQGEFFMHVSTSDHYFLMLFWRKH